MRLIWRGVAAWLGLVAVALAAGCSGGDQGIEPITVEQALSELDAVIIGVEMPDTVGSFISRDYLFAQQRQLLDGSDDAAGLVSARSHLAAQQTSDACAAIGTVLRGTLINKVLVINAEDAFVFGEGEMKSVDPSGIALTDSAGLVRHFVFGDLSVGQERFDGPVVSQVWTETVRQLMSIVYGLGDVCVGAAKEV